MKAFIFDSTTFDKAPYLKNYISEIEKLNGEYTVCSWDKYSNGKNLKDGNTLIIRRKWSNGSRKLWDFFMVSRNLKRVIKSGHYTHIVLVNSIWAFLLLDVLHDYNGKYLIDIRDYKCEKNGFFSIFLNTLIQNSFFTTVSSEGFRIFLPDSEKIIVNHNVSNMEFSEPKATLKVGKQHVDIVFMGHVRYRSFNEKVIGFLKNSECYSLTYRGTYAVGCDLYNDENLKSTNIVFKDRFNNADKPKLYKNYDMILSVYDNTQISVATLMPNRVYDCVQYKKPIIVSEGTYLAEVVKKYNLGPVVNLDKDNLVQKLNEYIAEFDEEKFLQGCKEFYSQVVKEQESYIYTVKEFFKN